LNTWVQQRPQNSYEGHFTSQRATQTYWLEFGVEGQVLRLILSLYHPEAFYQCKRFVTSLIMDAQYNLVGAFLGTELDLTYFQRRFSKVGGTDDSNCLEILISQLRAEHHSGAPGWESWDAMPAPVLAWLDKEGCPTEESFENVRYGAGRFAFRTRHSPPV
jgi:hypothetical protein